MYVHYLILKPDYSKYFNLWGCFQCVPYELIRYWGYSKSESRWIVPGTVGIDD